jgi:hypothetical protein
MSTVFNNIQRVVVREETIQVRELTAKEIAYILQKFTDTATSLINADGDLIVDREKIVKAVIANTDLAFWIMERACTRDTKWVESLVPREMFPLIEAILDLNLSEEVMAGGKKLLGRALMILPPLPKLSPGRTPSLSATADTPSAT